MSLCPKCGGLRVRYRVGGWKCQPCESARLREYKKKFGGAAAYRNRQRERAPEKYAARKQVETAIKWGKLAPLPCERCGSKNVHAHHEDYSRPLDVMWLCPSHHKERHQEIRAAQAIAAA